MSKHHFLGWYEFHDVLLRLIIIQWEPPFLKWWQWLPWFFSSSANIKLKKFLPSHRFLAGSPSGLDLYGWDMATRIHATLTPGDWEIYVKHSWRNPPKNCYEATATWETNVKNSWRNPPQKLFWSIAQKKRRRLWDQCQELFGEHSEKPFGGESHLLQRTQGDKRGSRPQAGRQVWRSDGGSFHRTFWQPKTDLPQRTIESPKAILPRNLYYGWRPQSYSCWGQQQQQQQDTPRGSVFWGKKWQPRDRISLQWWEKTWGPWSKSWENLTPKIWPSGMLLAWRKMGVEPKNRGKITPQNGWWKKSWKKPY